MPLFAYKVKNESGKEFKGEIKIQNREELAKLLMEKGFTPVEIKEKNAFTDISRISFFRKKVKVKDLAVFCRQFAIVLEAGVSIVSALDVLREQTDNPTFKECLTDVCEEVQKGTSLLHAMKMHHQIFPDILISMVEAGEVSGQLDRVFVRMAEHFEKEYKLNHKVKSAMTYPVIVCIVAALVVAILMIKVVPTFAEALKGFGGELPVYTRILMAVSGFFSKFWWLMAGLTALVVVAVKSYARTPEGKRFFASVAIRVPVFKNFTRAIVTARLTRTLGTMIASGVLMIQALEVAQKVIGNVVVTEKMNTVIDDVKKGKGLTQPLLAMKYFPPLLISMVRIGEETGNMDFSLDKAADFYDQELETSMQQLTTMIEPAITVILGVVVGFIILSIMVPIFSVYQGLANA